MEVLICVNYGYKELEYLSIQAVSMRTGICVKNISLIFECAAFHCRPAEIHKAPGYAAPHIPLRGNDR